MPAKKAASNVAQFRPATHDRKPKAVKPKRPVRAAGVEDVIDFDAEMEARAKSLKPKKFKLGGYTYTLGKGPNPYQLQQIDTTANFDITEFLAEYVIPSQRKRFLEAIRNADYDNADFGLLQTRIMEANADRPTGAS